MASVAESLNRAIEYHQSGELRKAEDIYHEVIRHDPHHADALHLLGLAAHQQNRSGSAVDYITRAIQENDKFAPYHSNLGVTYLQMGRKSESMECFQRALELEPDFPDATFNLGTLYFNEGEFPKALIYYEKGLQQLPQDEKTWMKIGMIHENTGSYVKAKECYEKILNWNPSSAEAMERVQTLEQKTASSASQSEATTKPETEPNGNGSTDELIEQASTYAIQGDLNNAADCYKQALNLDSMNSVALIGLGNILVQIGNEVKTANDATTETNTDSTLPPSTMPSETAVVSKACPSYEEVRNHMVGVITATPTCHDPFPYVFLNDIFPYEFYMQMREHIPSIEFYEDLIHPEAMKPDGTSTRKMFKLLDHKIEKLPTKQREFWLTYAPLFSSGELANAVFSRFTPPSHTIPSVCLFKDMAGYKILPHPDISEKQATMQFYLPEDSTKTHLGTRLYVKEESGVEDFRQVRQFAFVPNTGYAFEVSQTSWHAVEEIAEEDSPRESLMIVFHDPDQIQQQEASY